MAYVDIENEVLDRINTFVDEATTTGTTTTTALSGLATAMHSVLEADAVTYSAPGAKTDTSLDVYEYAGVSTRSVGSQIYTGETPDVPQIDASDYPAAINNPNFVSKLPNELHTLTLPDFNADLPSSTISDFDGTYSFTEPTYTARLETEVDRALEAVLDGGLVVPTSTWDALWDRAADDAARIQVSEEWAASNIAASMGMTGLPSETLLARLDAAEQKAAVRLSSVRLEQAIQEANQRREDWWNSIRDSIQFETMWINQNEGVANRALQSAADAHAAAIAAYNTIIAQYNALIARAAQIVAMTGLEMEGVRVKLEEYRTKLTRARQYLEEEEKQLQFEDTVEASKARSITSQLAAYNALWNGLLAEQNIIATIINARANELNADTQREGVEFQYDNMITQMNINTQDRTADTALKMLELQFNVTLQNLGTYASVGASLANAYLGASDVNLSANAQAGISWSQNVGGECASDVSCSPI